MYIVHGLYSSWIVTLVLVSIETLSHKSHEGKAKDEDRAESRFTNSGLLNDQTIDYPIGQVDGAEGGGMRPLFCACL